MGEVGAGGGLVLRRVRGLFDPEQLRLHRIRCGRTDRRHVDRRIAGRVGLVAEATGCRDRIRLVRLGIGTDQTGKVDIDRRLIGRIAAKGQLDDHKLVAGLPGNDHGRAVRLLGKRMDSLACRVKCQDRRLK